MQLLPALRKSLTLAQRSQRECSSTSVVNGRLIVGLMHSPVIYKLLGFTAAMVGGPIGTYFLTLNSVFSGLSQSAIWPQKQLLRNLKETQHMQEQLLPSWPISC